ncbi:MAG: lipopolysaccharide biosynthesis, partial [Rhodobacteraceae bacterium]|nr:lipopolysaccharide biosynthesis [Paracoccaceae bacterium]
NADSGVVVRKSTEELRLEELNASLQSALAIYAPDNPRVRLLETQIVQLETQIAAQEPEPTPETASDEAVAEETLPPVLQIQLDEVKSGVLSLELQKATLQTQVDELSQTILRTPEVAIVLEELEREVQVIQSQFNLAEDRLSKAQIGDRIETRSRGQRLSVIEQPSVPTEPTKPDRIKLAGAGTAFGIFVGLGLIALFELLNTSARRPEDIINRLGVTPLTTVPYIPTRGEVFRSRSLKLGLVLIILIGVPAAVYAVHVYYLPLDLIAEKIMNRLGVRL